MNQQQRFQGKGLNPVFRRKLLNQPSKEEVKLRIERLKRARERKRKLINLGKHPISETKRIIWGNRSNDFKTTMRTGALVGGLSSATIAGLEFQAARKNVIQRDKLSSIVDKVFAKRIIQIENYATEKVREFVRQNNLGDPKHFSAQMEKEGTGNNAALVLTILMPQETLKENKQKIQDFTMTLSQDKKYQEMNETANKELEINIKNIQTTFPRTLMSHEKPIQKSILAGEIGSGLGLTTIMLGLIGIRTVKKLPQKTRSSIKKIRALFKPKQFTQPIGSSKVSEYQVDTGAQQLTRTSNGVTKKVSGVMTYARTPRDFSTQTKIRYITQRLPNYVPKESINFNVGLLQEARLKQPDLFTQLNPTNPNEVRQLLETLAQEKAIEENIVGLKRKATQIQNQREQQWGVFLNKRAQSELDALPPIIRGNIVESINRLAANPFNVSGIRGVKLLKKTFRIRVGNYRVLFRFVQGKKTIEIIQIGGRAKIFRKIGQRN